ncbi:MAG: chondroitinase-B domain-containing protein [Saprospiraceae bacterium]
MKNQILFLFLILPFTLISQVYVNDSEDLEDLVNAASPWDIFIVEDGNYNDFESTFTAIGNATAPITIKAETIGGVVLTGESQFVLKKAAHIIIEGFVFDAEGEETLIKLEGCNNIRITRNVFELATTEPIKWVFVGGIWNDDNFEFTSHDNRIDHNIFQNKTTPGHYITIDGTSNEDEEDYRQSQCDRIDHNYFRNNSPRASNEKESIRIGWSEMSMSSGYTTVEHNLFEDCDGDPEIVSVKSCDNIIRNNTFTKSYGTLSLRHGNRNRVEGNYFFGGGKPNGSFDGSTIYTGGIRIYGTDHLIINNYMEGLQGTKWDAPIALTQGDAIDGSSTNLSKHFRAERVTIAYNTLVNNTHGIEIGFDNNGNYNKKLSDITIAHNIVTGSENNLVKYVDGNTQNDAITWINNVMHPTGSATLTNDGSSFASTEVNVMNPNLNFDGTTWRATSTSPLLEHNISGWEINQDIDGQPRPLTSTVGADHFSTDLVQYFPLSPDDVGPNAYEINEELTPCLFTVSQENLLEKSAWKIFPNPSSSHITIENYNAGANTFTSISLWSIDGRLLLEKKVNSTDATLDLDVSGIANGIYFIRLSSSQKLISEKIIIQR